MAANSVTVVLDAEPQRWGHENVPKGTVALSTSYSTGGDLIAASTLGIGNITDMLIFPTGGWVFSYNSTNGSIQAYGQYPTTTTASVIALAEATSGANLSAVVARFRAFGA